VPTIDADAHVIESMETWRFLRDDEQQFQPAVVEKIFGGKELYNLDGQVQRQYWLIDRRIHERDGNVGSNTSEESREMRDVAARLSHMDALEIDYQMLYPTLLLRPVADKAPLDDALTRSYNRWLAEIWRKGKGRLRWVAVPALRSREKIRDELTFAKEHGACGVFMRALECELPVNDPYFYPLYEAASDLDLAICFHLGNASFAVHDFYQKDTTFTKFKLPTIGTFHSLVMSELPARFPQLRWGFIEVSANWLPFILADLQNRFARRGKVLAADVLAKNRIYVSCEISDDLEAVLKVAGEDNLVIGTDYGHADMASDIEALRGLRRAGKLASRAVDKILWDNPRALYGIS
jgi:predicted TIM-barrel fold metal-dependent hydrolase